MMNNLPLQPLVWARIDTEKLAGIYCQKTDSYIKDAVSFCSTPVAEYVIRQDKETGKYRTNYGGRTENPYDTIDEAEHWAEHTHYASQMQPYVKPMPTWISVDDRLPEQNTKVLVRYHAHFDDEKVKEFDVCTAFFCGLIFDVKDQHFYTRRIAKVTQWMPIPEFSEVTK